MRKRLVYVLHSGNLYGTERMALATAEGLVDEFDPVIIAPAGEAVLEARRLGFTSRTFSGIRDLMLLLRQCLADNGSLAFIATGVAHSLVFATWNGIYRRKAKHLHLVHGGTDERLSYGRKRWLNHTDVTFVAVSDFVRQRLVANRVRPNQVAVIENFLPDTRVSSAPKRPPIGRPGVVSLVVVSRVDPIKRVDLLLDALDLAPSLRTTSVKVFGTGWDLEKLRARASRNNPNVEFCGFRPNIAEALAQSDLFLHLCPEEPFGLAILEAMAAGLPVLVPDRGGAGSLVNEGVSGFHFKSNDAGDLARRLTELREASPQFLENAVSGGFRALATRFSARDRIADYRQLLCGTE